ncbi:MAG: PilW family protein, partial [Gammaproteobacteria bacterium]
MRAMTDTTVLQRARSRGLSLVELLVAAAIGIIASLAIFQVFAVFEGQKRTTASGGEAQTSGTLALYTL